jgi:hypothetical protein
MSYSSFVIMFFCVYSLQWERAHRTVAQQWTIPACPGNVLASRWRAMDYSGFQASCHNIYIYTKAGGLIGDASHLNLGDDGF